MKQFSYCEYCLKKTEYKIKKINKKSNLKDQEINYIGFETTCKKCKNEIFVQEVYKKNMTLLYDKYRESNNLIKVSEIKEMLSNYKIDEVSLASLLDIDKESIVRYLNGDMVSNEDSEVLKKIYNSENYYLMVLQSNKDKISPVTYNKSKKALKHILSLKETEKKVDSIIKYIINNCEDVTQYYLYKLLYYIQGFCFVINDKFIFEEDFIVDEKGPVLNSVFQRYELYGFNEVNNYILKNNELELETKEKEIVDSIIKYFGCYSGKILSKMIYSESPWILTKKNFIRQIRENIDDDIDSTKVINKDLILSYFSGVREKFLILDSSEIEKYSSDLINKVSML